MSSLVLKKPQKIIETLQLTRLKAQRGRAVFISARPYLQQLIFLGETDYVHKAADDMKRQRLMS